MAKWNLVFLGFYNSSEAVYVALNYNFTTLLIEESLLEIYKSKEVIDVNSLILEEV